MEGSQGTFSTRQVWSNLPFCPPKWPQSSNDINQTPYFKEKSANENSNHFASMIQTSMISQKLLKKQLMTIWNLLKSDIKINRKIILIAPVNITFL